MIWLPVKPASVVTIRSQLRPVTQERAQLVRGYDEDHVSILKNADVSAIINEILEENLQNT